MPNDYTNIKCSEDPLFAKVSGAFYVKVEGVLASCCRSGGVGIHDAARDKVE